MPVGPTGSQRASVCKCESYRCWYQSLHGASPGSCLSRLYMQGTAAGTLVIDGAPHSWETSDALVAKSAVLMSCGEPCSEPLGEPGAWVAGFNALGVGYALSSSGNSRGPCGVKVGGHANELSGA